MLPENESDGLMLLCPLGSVAAPALSSFSVSWKSLGLETSRSPRALFPKAASVLMAITEGREVSECRAV